VSRGSEQEAEREGTSDRGGQAGAKEEEGRGMLREAAEGEEEN